MNGQASNSIYSSSEIPGLIPVSNRRRERKKNLKGQNPNKRRRAKNKDTKPAEPQERQKTDTSDGEEHALDCLV